MWRKTIVSSYSVSQRRLVVQSFEPACQTAGNAAVLPPSLLALSHLSRVPVYTQSHSTSFPWLLGDSYFLRQKKKKQSSKVQPPTILHNLKWGALFSSVQAGVIQTETSFGRNLKQDDSSCFDRVQGWQMGINSQKKALKKKKKPTRQEK